MENNETHIPYVINLLGSPGAGKSTLAAHTFSRLKMLGVNCELVTEFAKDKTWEQNDIALANQVYVFANQYFRMDRCSRRVDVLITDSPLLLSPMYNRNPDLKKPLEDLVFAINRTYRNLYYFVERVKKYNPVGRSQTEAESDKISMELKKMIDGYGVQYTTIPGRLESSDVILEQLLPLLEGRLADTSDDPKKIQPET